MTVISITSSARSPATVNLVLTSMSIAAIFTSLTIRHILIPDL